MSNFKCKRCGKCCSNILPLTKADIKNIRCHCKNQSENRLLALKDWYMMCPFLNHKNECTIYEYRPTICREYTCDKFENGKLDDSFVEMVKKYKFYVTDMREYFFGNKINKA